MSTRNQHISTALVVTQAIEWLIILSCLLTLMISLMGGSREGVDVQAVRSLQQGGILVSVLAILASAAYFRTIRRENRFWHYIPGWLLFSTFMLLFMAFIGELSFVMLRDVGLVSADSVDHLATACLVSASLGLAMLHAVARHYGGRGPCKRGRW